MTNQINSNKTKNSKPQVVIEPGKKVKQIKVPKKAPILPTTPVKKDKLKVKQQLAKTAPKVGVQDAGVNSFTDVLDTAVDVIKVGGTIAGNPLNPLSYMDVPKTLTKVINTIVDFSGKAPVNVPVLSGPLTGQKDDKFVKELGKEFPVFHTSSIPTSFITEFKTPEFKIVPSNRQYNGMKAVRVTGTSWVAVIAFPVTNIVGEIYCANNSGGYALPLVAMGNLGPRMNNIVVNYDRHCFNSITWNYVPSCPTITPGNISMFARYAPRSPQNVNSRVPITDASQMEEYCTGSTYGSLSMTLNRGFGLKFNGSTSSNISDIKFYSDWFVCVGTSGGSTSTYGDILGNLFINFDIDLVGAVSTPNYPALIHNQWVTRFLLTSVYQHYNLLTSKDIRSFLKHCDAIVMKAIKHSNSLLSVDCSSFILSIKDQKKNPTLSVEVRSDIKLSSFLHNFVMRDVIPILDRYIGDPQLSMAIRSFLSELFNNNVCLTGSYELFTKTRLSYTILDADIVHDFDVLNDPNIGYLTFVRVAIHNIIEQFMSDVKLDFISEDYISDDDDEKVEIGEDEEFNDY